MVEDVAILDDLPRICVANNLTKQAWEEIGFSQALECE